jgi:uncharacterized membrane protein
VRRLLAYSLIFFMTLPMQVTAWELSRNDGERGIRVYLRDNPASSYKSFYAVTHVKNTMGAVVAVLSDVPAMPEWIARMKSVKLLRRNANKELWVHARYQLPYPFLERETVLQSSLQQDPITKTVIITTRSVPGFIVAGKNRVRLLNMHSTWKISPEKEGLVRIEFWGEGEPGGYVPPILFNYNLPDEPVQTLRNLRKMLTREKYRTKRLHYIREG